MKRTLFRGERGAATVEFAIIAIVFLTILFGIIEFGILMFDQHVLTNASREGARAGIVMRIPRVSEADIKKTVDDYAKENMVTFGTPNDPDTDVIWRVWVKDLDAKPKPTIAIVEYDPATLPSDIVIKFGDELVVKVTYDFDFLFLSIVGIGPINLTAETRMRME